MPQTWQGWAVVAGFITVLCGSVLAIQRLLGDTGESQGLIFVVAAIEIMGFMAFVRKRSQPSSGRLDSVKTHQK
jgi:hypothetical protein